MQNSPDYTSFRISAGGLFYRLLVFLHIHTPGRYSTRRRVAFLIALSWLPLLLLTILEGNLINSSLDVPFVYDLKPYVRFLIVLPLLIAAEPLIDRLIAYNLQSIGSSGILAEDDQEQYATAIEKLAQRKESVIADIIILASNVLIVLAFLANLEELDTSTEFTNWMVVQSHADANPTLAGWWFLLVSTPVFLIVLFRWFWRFYLWSEFLFRLSRINLKLQPTHPDLFGGLGIIIKNSEGAFILVFFAFGAMLSVALAEDILYGGTTLAEMLPVILSYILTAIVIMALPLLFFSGKLVQAKRWGRVVYGGLGYRLSRGFDKKWGDLADLSSGDELLRTADSSAVCDYADIYDAVSSMQFLPINRKGFLTQAFVLAIPFVPLVFTEITIRDILDRILGTLI